MKTTDTMFKAYVVSQIMLLVALVPAVAKAQPIKSMNVTSTVTQAPLGTNGYVTQSAVFESNLVLQKDAKLNPETDAITLRLQVAGIVDPDFGDWDLPDPTEKAGGQVPDWWIVHIPAGSLSRVDSYTWTLKRGSPVGIVLVNAYGETVYDYAKHIYDRSVQEFMYHPYVTMQIGAKAFFEKEEPDWYHPDPENLAGIAQPEWYLPDTTDLAGGQVPDWWIVGSASNYLLTFGNNYGMVQATKLTSTGSY